MMAGTNQVPATWFAGDAGIRRLAHRERWLLALPCLCVLATTMAFYGAHLIRSSMEPSVVLGAAIFVARLPLGRGRRSSPFADVGGDVGGDVAAGSGAVGDDGARGVTGQ